MKRIFTCIMVIAMIPMQMWAQGIATEEMGNIKWHKFEWYKQEKVFFENTTNKVMLANFHVSGIPDAQGMAINLNSPFTYIFDGTYDYMVYRNPSLANQTEVVQRVSNLRERVVKNMEISINRHIIGEDNLFVQPTPEESKDSKVKGLLGFGIFHRNKKILIVDNVEARFASLDELPAAIAEKTIFVPMKVELGYLVIPVMIDGKEVEMFFDGTSRPALVVFNNRTLRQIASSVPASEKLMHNSGRNSVLLDGFEPEKDIMFGNLTLSRFNVFVSDEKAPSGIRGSISRAFFDDYIMIFDYQNERFGIVSNELLAK
jgi:hypothetical protein